jgi:hypothetical protein
MDEEECLKAAYSIASPSSLLKQSCVRVKKKQIDVQLILSIFRQPLHVSGVSRSIIRRYNRLCTEIGTYYSEKRIV